MSRPRGTGRRHHPSSARRPKVGRNESLTPHDTARNNLPGQSKTNNRNPPSGSLRRLLEGIGVPPAPLQFTPDDFQIEAWQLLEREDVLVTAPTGSGKTWIAREKIRELLARGGRAWYTSPLKALTNSKYAEFSKEFGASHVGILTGDRKENPDAPLIVGTTEIYRNQLFDALRGGAAVEADLVVLDEAHYLGDEERGHVWEEAIVLTPPRVRLLLLSATIGNAEELAAWMQEVRGVRCGIVSRPGKRPVPLRAAFLYPDGSLASLTKEASGFNTEIIERLQAMSARSATGWADQRSAQRRDFGLNRRDRIDMREMPPALLVDALGAHNLLPAIVFLPMRRRCDDAASEAVLHRRYAGEEAAERREARRKFLREFAAEHREIRKHKHWEMIVKGGVASHHGGHLPAWKLAIESLMSMNLLDAIFATSTVAAGVDFPARTVVLTGVDVRTGHGWRSLSASEMQQMTGRAGRRGRDNVGFIIAAPGTHQNPQRLYSLLEAAPDKLESQFRATYTTLLNLLDAYGSFAHVRDIAERSFAQRGAAHYIHDSFTEADRIKASIRERLGSRFGNQLTNSSDVGSGDSGCAGLTLDMARGLERLSSARTRLLEGAPQTRREAVWRWLDEEVAPGRVVSIGRSSRRLVFVTERRSGELTGVREDGRRASLVLDRVGRIYEKIYPLSGQAREEAFADVHLGRVPLLDEPHFGEVQADTDEAVRVINNLIDKLVPEAADKDARKMCMRTLWSVIGEVAELERIERRIASKRDAVWQPFEQRARVLDSFGYLEFAREQVTERGRWLADLRLDRPLLVGEALARNLFSQIDMMRAAGVMAALVADPERSYGDIEIDDKLIAAVSKFEEIAGQVAVEEFKQNIEPLPDMNYSAAAAAAWWASGAKWSDLVRETMAEEGDLFRMLSRTGESLLQIGHLRRTHPEAARIASTAAAAILREPVRAD